MGYSHWNVWRMVHLKQISQKIFTESWLGYFERSWKNDLNIARKFIVESKVGNTVKLESQIFFSENMGLESYACLDSYFD